MGRDEGREVVGTGKRIRRGYCCGWRESDKKNEMTEQENDGNG